MHDISKPLTQLGFEQNYINKFNKVIILNRGCSGCQKKIVKSLSAGIPDDMLVISSLEIAKLFDKVPSLKNFIIDSNEIFFRSGVDYYTDAVIDLTNETAITISRIDAQNVDSLISTIK